MNRLFKRIAIAATVLIASLTTGVLSACSYGLDQEQKKREEGYSCCVTYDANGGTFGANTTRTYALVKENSPAPAPGYVDGQTQASVKVPARKDYQLVGEAEVASTSSEDKNKAAIQSKSWFLAETDEDGNVIYEGEGENKTPVLARDTAWDFARDKVTEDITLVAKWEKVYRYILCLTETVEEDGVLVEKEKELRSYSVQPGATIADKIYKTKGGTPFRRADYIKPSISGYTLLEFYMDEDLTELMQMNLTHPGTFEKEVTTVDPETGEPTTETVTTNDVKIYAKYLKGKFDIVSNDNIRNLTSTSNWYLVEDVDLSNTTWSAQSSFTGKIYGNGFALKNATITSYATKPSGAYKQHSLFGNMNGLLDNVTFESFTFKVDTQYGATGILGEQRIAFLGYALGERGELKNVTLKDCKISRKDDTYYTATFGDATNLFYETPAAERVQATIVETGVTPNPQSVMVVTE